MKPRLRLPPAPVRSGIADYSLDLLPHLAALADVRLIRLPRPAGRSRDRAALADGPRSRRPARAAGCRSIRWGTTAITSRCSTSRCACPACSPSTTSSSTTCCSTSPSAATSRAGSGTTRPASPATTAGSGEAAALAKRWNAWGDAPIFELPAHRALLRRQRGVLVHSEWAAAFLAEEEIGVPRAGRPHGRAAAAGGGRGGGPRAAPPLRPAGRRPVLGSFGFQTPIKRTVSAVRALAAPGLEAGPPADRGRGGAGDGPRRGGVRTPTSRASRPECVSRRSK